MFTKAKMKQPENARRIYRFDYMKAFLIFCVVLGHITYWFPGENYLLHCTQLWIYFFHMPAFVFLAGLFSKNTVNEKKWEKVVPYFILYLLMKVVIYFVDIYRGLDGAEINFLVQMGLNGLLWHFFGGISLRLPLNRFILVIFSLYLSVYP